MGEIALAEPLGVANRSAPECSKGLRSNSLTGSLAPRQNRSPCRPHPQYRFIYPGAHRQWDPTRNLRSISIGMAEQRSVRVSVRAKRSTANQTRNVSGSSAPFLFTTTLRTHERTVASMPFYSLHVWVALCAYLETRSGWIMRRS